MSGNEHIPMTFDELAVLLRDMARAVEEHDSFEGSVEYLMPDVASPEAPDVVVRAVYRHGQAIGGQGGVRIIGTMGGRP